MAEWTAVAAAVALAGCRARVERVEWTTMGTVAAVQVRGDGQVRPARDACARAFSRVERSFNVHDPGSRISRFAALSDDEARAAWSDWELKCVDAATRLREESGGAFDPRWRGPATLDLGAIAKGFAVDCAEAAVLESANAGGDVLVDLGGNVKAVRGAWRVGVKDPGGDGCVASVELAPGEALATSAEYYRGRHIYDGRTGRPAESGVASVTVLCRSATLADGLSTVMFVLGPDAGLRLLRDRAYGASALFVMSDGRTVCSDGRFDVRP